MSNRGKELDELTVSLFCRDMAMMMAAGTQPYEALALLEEDTKESGEFSAAAEVLASAIHSGKTFAEAVRGVLPAYGADMIAAGEKAGRTEQVLDRLADYYEREHYIKQRLYSALLYPLLLLLLMCLILGFLVWKVVPVFVGEYSSLAGSLAGSSYAYVAASRIFSWAALVITLVICVLMVTAILMARHPTGKARLAAIMEKLPLTASASRLLAVSRMTDTLAIFTASGIDPDTAMREACRGITHSGLRASAERCCTEMADGASLAQAVTKEKLYEPLYCRMLQSGSRSGKLDTTLSRLADITGKDTEEAVYGLIEGIEPLLTAFLTVAVGVTLLSAMLPLIGILGSIG